MKPISDHPDRIQLTAFLDGRLQEDDRILIESHVEHCEACCQAMSELPHDTLSGRLLDVDTSAEELSLPRDGQPATSDDATEIPAALRDHPRYRILGPLGKGGMGVVYKAQHRMMDRAVALKVIDSRFIENPQAIERFRTEVKAAARLTHANIVRAYDAEQADHLHFLVMEYVDGISLAELLRRNGPLPVHQVCGIVRKVAQGLQHAFEQGMVHRDIKPQNIMVTQDGRIRILDFGLARLAREREIPIAAGGGPPRDQMRQTADALTLAGTVLGTPDYIAPEQAMDARQADIRADIYSLGCTCYFLLTGLPPYPTGSAMDKLIAHSERTPTSILEHRADVPADILAIVRRMMERKPDDRYQAPREIAQAMDDFLKGGTASPTAATHSDHAAVATVNEDSPAVDLRMVDLDAISIGDSSALSTVELADTTADHAQPQPLPLPPPRTTSAKPGTSRASSRRSASPIRRATAGLGWYWVMLGPVLAGLAIVTVMSVANFLFPEADTTSVPVPLPGRSNIDAPPPRDIAVVPQSGAGRWIDLLPSLDLEANTGVGTWRTLNSELQVNQVEWASLSLPYDLPAVYDFEVQFTRNTGVNSIALIFNMHGNQATWEIDAWGDYIAGIQRIDGQDCRDNGTEVTDIRLVNGERHTARVRVLKGHVEAYLDGKQLTGYRGDGSNLSLDPRWRLPITTGLGLAAYNSGTTFHRVRLRSLVPPTP